MPRSLQEVLEHADELARRFEEYEPKDVRTAAALYAIREAVVSRAVAERQVAQTIAMARDAGVSWSAIASMLGTSGEAARKRYAGQHAKSAKLTRPRP